jgi:hypothetical protein
MVLTQLTPYLNFDSKFISGQVIEFRSAYFP